MAGSFGANFFSTGYANGGCKPSGSSFNSKRKRTSWTNEDFEYEQAKHMRVRSPQLDRRATFPLNPPELMTDHSNSASDEDQDQSMDMDGDGDHDMDGMEEGSSFQGLDGPSHESRMGIGYSFGDGGSGGFGFGPGAEEDEEEEEMDFGSTQKPLYPAVSPYPSLTAHPNPHHFTNASSSFGAHAHTHARATSPFAAQAFSTTLRAPGHTSPRSGAHGILQPAMASALPFNATDVDKARAQHGPQCTRIPKLVLSQYPDPITGKKSMWTVCEDCGACEPAQM